MATTEEEIVRLKAAQRELHETIQEAKLVQHELDESISAFKGAAANLIETAVSDGLRTYAASLDRAIADATNRVYARFDKISDLLLGEERSQKRKGLPSIEELAQAYAEKQKKEQGG